MKIFLMHMHCGNPENPTGQLYPQKRIEKHSLKDPNSIFHELNVEEVDVM